MQDRTSASIQGDNGTNTPIRPSSPISEDDGAGENFASNSGLLPQSELRSAWFYYCITMLRVLGDKFTVQVAQQEYAKYLAKYGVTEGILNEPRQPASQGPTNASIQGDNGANTPIRPSSPISEDDGASANLASNSGLLPQSELRAAWFYYCKTMVRVLGNKFTVQVAQQEYAKYLAKYGVTAATMKETRKPASTCCIPAMYNDDSEELEHTEGNTY